MNVIIADLEHGEEEWERSAKFVEQLEKVQIAAAEKIPGFSSFNLVTNTRYSNGKKSRTGNAPTQDKYLNT